VKSWNLVVPGACEPANLGRGGMMLPRDQLLRARAGAPRRWPRSRCPHIFRYTTRCISPG
jgi:hypothetical protein